MIFSVFSHEILMRKPVRFLIFSPPLKGVRMRKNLSPAEWKENGMKNHAKGNARRPGIFLGKKFLRIFSKVPTPLFRENHCADQTRGIVGRSISYPTMRSWARRSCVRLIEPSVCKARRSSVELNPISSSQSVVNLFTVA